MKKIPERFYIVGGVPLVNCPFCNQRPYFESRKVAPGVYPDGVTRERITLKSHYQFSIDCSCGARYKRSWGLDVYNTAKRWNRRFKELVWFPPFTEEVVSELKGNPHEIPTFTTPEFEEIYPGYAMLTSPMFGYGKDANFQKVPAEIGDPSKYYPWSAFTGVDREINPL